VVSHGRTIVGLGAAWHEPEFTAYGWPFPPLKVRMEMLAEAVQVVDRMLTQMILSQLQEYAKVGSQYVTFNLVDSARAQCDGPGCYMGAVQFGCRNWSVRVADCERVSKQ